MLTSFKHYGGYSSKNIFHDRDLLKLSPDYCPPDVTLRMHERRFTFRDSHRHVWMDSNSNRRTIKKIKDGYKINKEIMKIRNGFQNNNLKNQIVMKNCIRNSKLKTDLVSTGGDLLLKDLKILHDDAEKCMLDIEEDMSKLVLQNDSDFKVNYKPMIEKLTNDSRKNKPMPPLSPVTKINKSEETTNEHLIRIECSYANKTLERGQEVTNTTTDEVEHERTEIITQVQLGDDLKNNVEHSFDSQDLKTLLIMMAIAKPDKNDDDFTSSKNKIDTPKMVCQENININCASTTLDNGQVTDILSITSLRIDMNENEAKVAKKYIEKWKMYMSKKKETMIKQRQKCLDTFFDKLAKKKNDAKQSKDSVNKAKIVARDYNTYQQRYQVQKHIIALQKAKLEEQNRIIEELKYNRIIEASRHSVDVLKDEVRKTYFDIDRQLKPKIKCLTNELKLKEIEEPSLVLHCLKVPRFLQRMEKRAREREEKHAMIRERRRQMEEERVRLKQQAELAKADMDKEERMKQIEALREKRRKEQIENIRRKQHAARLRSLIVMADLHYERTLKAKYGIRPFRILLQIKRDNLEKAKSHYAFQLKKNVFLHWMWYTEDMWYERYFLAESFDRKKKLRRAFDCFKLNVHGYNLKKQVADDYYDLFVTQLVFRKFKEAINTVKKENEAKFQKAVQYYNSNLLFKVLTCWRTLPALNALKREQEARKARWREKVLQVVPDYIPPDDP